MYIMAYCMKFKSYILLTAYNRIGSGPPSNTIPVTTKGSRPVKPTAAHFLQSNSSSITLNLAAWNSSDCPVTSFLIEYKPKASSSWNIGKQTKAPTLQLRLMCTATVKLKSIRICQTGALCVR